MKLTEQEYNQLLANPLLDSATKEELGSQALKEQWSFLGSDFD